ncbi:MAG: hypothetical protein ACFCUG_06880 [Thiotrichales bacterium]
MLKRDSAPPGKTKHTRSRWNRTLRWGIAIALWGVGFLTAAALHQT